MVTLEKELKRTHQIANILHGKVEGGVIQGERKGWKQKEKKDCTKKNDFICVKELEKTGDLCLLTSRDGCGILKVKLQSNASCVTLFCFFLFF